MVNGVSIVEMSIEPQKVQCSQLNETVSAEPSFIYRSQIHVANLISR
jgi:hypothetical protein